MNKFELFTLIYFVLEAYYEDEAEKNEKLNVVLSDMNPFVWEDCISADPTMYAEYVDFIGDRQISIENSLAIAKDYVKTIEFYDVTEAFAEMTEDEWIPVCKEYLESAHKGMEVGLEF